MLKAIIGKINWALIIFVVVYSIIHAVGNGDGILPWWFRIVALALAVGLIYEMVMDLRK